MTWEKLKSTLYHEDGSLRDIYIRDITIEDWRRWIECINAQYLVDFEVAGKKISDQIDFNVVAAYWQKPQEDYISASIYLGKIIVKVYFFIESEIEKDITPKEIRALDDHENLIDFLMTVSKYVGKPVELTEENCQTPEEVLMVVDGAQIIFTK